ncbi:MAG: G1 family glutamic endopeptidase [Thermoplasmata archaeon]
MVLVGILVVSVVGFAVVMSPGASSPHAVATPQVPGSLTHFGHTMIPATIPGTAGASSAGPFGCPLAAANCYGSYNWGGFVVYDASYVVSKVVGSWTVPAITGVAGTTCPDAQKTWESNSVWVGIDGFMDGTVEQTGTSSDCHYGTAHYYAWYEFYPSGSVSVPFTIKAGDAITASVLYVGHNASGSLFTTTISDKTTGTTYTSPKTAVPGADRNSAEWIDESPYYNGYLGLTQVGQIKFTGADATIGGVSHTISGWGTNVKWLLMVDYNFPYSKTLTYAKAEPSALSSSGNSFTVKWLSYGP